MPTVSNSKLLTAKLYLVLLTPQSAWFMTETLGFKFHVSSPRLTPHPSQNLPALTPVSLLSLPPYVSKLCHRCEEELALFFLQPPYAYSGESGSLGT